MQPSVSVLLENMDICLNNTWFLRQGIENNKHSYIYIYLVTGTLYPCLPGMYLSIIVVFFLLIATYIFC